MPRASNRAKREGTQDLSPHAEDLRNARQYAEELGLGTVEGAMRGARLGVRGQIGCLTALLAPPAGGLGLAIAGLLMNWTALVVTTVVTAALIVAGILVYIASAITAKATQRVFWYSEGVLQRTSMNSRARILRWADVDSVAVWARPAEVRHVDSCTLYGQTIIHINVLHGFSAAERRAFTLAAERHLLDRFVPPLITTYESGEPVALGAGRFMDKTGIQTPRQQVSWADIQTVTMRHSAGGPAAPILAITFKVRRRLLPVVVDLINVRNGIFLPWAVAYAAARNGAEVVGFGRAIPQQ